MTPLLLASFVCCIGTMLSFRFFKVSFHFCVLWLLFHSLPGCTAVCTTCYGEGQGCPGDGSTCPWLVGVAANVAAISAAVGGALTVSKLLPPKFVRLFPRAVLDGVSALVVRSQGGNTTYDVTNKTGQELFKAASTGALSKKDAILALHALIVATPDDAVGVAQTKKLESTLKALDVMELKVVDSSLSEGPLLYILFKISGAFASPSEGSTSFDLCLDCDSSVDTKTSHKTFSATLVRPSSPWHCVSILNAFSLCCNALGVATFLTCGPFFEDIFYEPVRSGVVPWPVAFECIILYLRMIEASPDIYTLGNVVHKAGGLDAIRAQATTLASTHFPSSVMAPGSAFFRGLGGIPKAGEATGLYAGNVRGDNKSSSRGCVSWNLGKPHQTKHVDESGTCRFRHACDQFVSDKGPGGQCLGSHKRKDCDYDVAKRVTKPSK